MYKSDYKYIRIKKVIKLSLMIIIWISLSGCSKSVYICTGDYSKRYHKTDDCYGLSNCRAQIKEISISKAERMGRTPCEKCKP